MADYIVKELKEENWLPIFSNENHWGKKLFSLENTCPSFTVPETIKLKIYFLKKSFSTTKHYLMHPGKLFGQQVACKLHKSIIFTCFLKICQVFILVFVATFHLNEASNICGKQWSQLCVGGVACLKIAVNNEVHLSWVNYSLPKNCTM